MLDKAIVRPLIVGAELTTRVSMRLNAAVAPLGPEQSGQR